MIKRLLAFAMVPVAAIIVLVPIPNSVFYSNRRPTHAGRAIGRAWAWMAAAGVTPYSWPGQPRGGTVALEVYGRRSGRPHQTVITWVEHEGERYFASMLDGRADWVRNVRASGGEAVIVHGDRRPVRLEAVPVDQRAPVLRAYLKRTRGATQKHLDNIAVDAPIAEFQRIAADHPVFRIVEASP